jgi:hypothetical protein
VAIAAIGLASLGVPGWYSTDAPGTSATCAAMPASSASVKGTFFTRIVVLWKRVPEYGDTITTTCSEGSCTPMWSSASRAVLTYRDVRFGFSAKLHSPNWATSRPSSCRWSKLSSIDSTV